MPGRLLPEPHRFRDYAAWLYRQDHARSEPYWRRELAGFRSATPLGIEEARSFSTLIQQSAELGSSITEALRVYSDDMRHKRLSRAEEKAYSLPAKLSVPMMICIFRCCSS